MTIGIVGFGAYRVNMGYISSGELMAFILYLFQIVAPVGTVSRFITSVQSATGATQRIFEILEHKEERKNGDPLKISEPSVGMLELNNISFKYDHTPILKDISIKIKPNTVTAIVRASSGSRRIFLFIGKIITQIKVKSFKREIAFGYDLINGEKCLMMSTRLTDCCWYDP